MSRIRRTKPVYKMLAVGITAILCTLLILSSVFPLPIEPKLLSIGTSSTPAFAQDSGNWTINGTTVYWDDDKAYLSATPHTLEGSGWVEFELLSKSWSGDIDVVWGFPSNIDIKPRNPQRWALNVSHECEREVLVEESYTLDVCNITDWTQLEWNGIEPDIGNHNNTHIYNVTAYDWQCTGDATNTTTTYIIAFNSYEGNKQHATFYGNRDTYETETYYEYYDDWVSWNPPPMQSVNYTYAGVDQWHIIQVDKAIEAGKVYKVRAWFDWFAGFDHTVYKYVWAVKPQSESIQEAKQNGHLYLLDPWLSGGWNQRMQITIDRSKFDNTDTTHFPVTVILDSSDTDFWTEMGSGDSKKVAFTKNDGETELYAEIEKYDDTSDSAIYHVSKSDWTINNDGASDDYFYMYYDSSHADNTGMVGDDPDDAATHNVWDSNFKLVSHMKDYPDTSHIADSTSNNNDGTKKSANNPAETSSGKVGAAQDFSTDWITPPEIVSGLDKVTVEAWTYLDTSSGDSAIYGHYWSKGQILLYEDDPNGWRFVIADSNVDVSHSGYGNAGQNGVWTHIAGVYDKDDYIGVYEDGSETSSYVISRAAVRSETGATIGADEGSGRFFDGKIDEIRISDTDRSAAWIKATYNSLNDSLLTYGTEETPTPTISNSPDNNDFGTLQVAGTGNTTISYFTIENTGNCAVDVTIQGTDMTGGDDTWTLASDASPGENIYGLKAGLDDVDDNYDTVVNATANSFVTNLAESATQDWGLKLWMPTSLNGYNNNEMSGTITLVASEAA